MRCLVETGYLNSHAFSNRIILYSSFVATMASLCLFSRQFLILNRVYIIHTADAGWSDWNKYAKNLQPSKNGKEHDPKGVFIKQWIPELSMLPEAIITPGYEFFETSIYGFKLGKDYPMPIIDLEKSRKMPIYPMADLQKSCSKKRRKKNPLNTLANRNSLMIKKQSHLCRTD